MSSTNSPLKYYFSDPRLGMTWAGRFLVLVCAEISYVLLFASAAVFLVSDVRWLEWTGALIGIFLIDRLMHRRNADRSISEIPDKGEVNAAHFITPAAFAHVQKAFGKSLITKRSFYLELLASLIRAKEVREGLRRLDIPIREFSQKLEDILKEEVSREEETKSEKLKKAEGLMVGSLLVAIDNEHKFTEIPDIFTAMGSVGDAQLSRLFGSFSLVPGDVGDAMAFGAMVHNFGLFRRLPRILSGMVMGKDRKMRHRIMNRAWTSRPTPNLDKYSIDLTDLARQGRTGFLIGHKTEYAHLLNAISKASSPNAILIGDAGIGKETVVQRLGLDIVKDNVPQALFDKRLVQMRVGDLVASASPEELQRRVIEIVSEIMIAGNIILYIPDIHNLAKTSGGFLSAADGFLPLIKDSRIPMIGGTFSRDYKQIVSARSDFQDLFEPIYMQEITESEAKRVLSFESLILERETKIFITFGAVKTAVDLAKKYFHNKYLPGSAEGLLKSGLVEAERRGDKYLGPDHIVKVAEQESNIPIHKVSGKEGEDLLNLEEIIHRSFIDQEEAVKAISDSLREYRSGLSRSGGPIASFLFVGPTGVGKTELSKLLAKIQFGSEKNMIRFDMTEFQDKQAIYRFIGSPDGSTTGALTEAVNQKPFSLVLLDEFEKAAPEILVLFLQVLDDGRLTDSTGRLIDFQNTIIIATSNAHSDIVNESLRQGQSVSQVAEYLKSKLTDVFKPELLNRFSKIIVFKELSPADVLKVAKINLKGVGDSLMERGIELDCDETALKEIAKRGYDPAFGVRPLRRVIDENVRAILAVKILKGEVKQGQKLKLVFKDGEFAFENQVKEEAISG